MVTLTIGTHIHLGNSDHRDPRMFGCSPRRRIYLIVPDTKEGAMRFFNSGLREARCVSLLPILKQVGSGCHATASSGEGGGPRKSRDCFDAGVERGCRLRRRRLRLRYRALGGSVVMTRSDPRAAYPSQEPGKIFYGTIGKYRDLGGDNSPVISPCVAKCTNR